MQLGQSIINVAIKIGWRVTPDLILAKKLVGTEEVCVDPLSISRSIAENPHYCGGVDDEIEKILLISEGSSVLELMFEEEDR